MPTPRLPLPLRLAVLAPLVAVAACAAPKVASAAGECSQCASVPLDPNCTFLPRPEWSFLIFASSWPGTFCLDGCCKLPPGVDSISPGFTIHGLWPNYDGLAYPTCCVCPFTRLHVVTMLMQDDKVLDKLRLYWPVLKRCDFLQYEYDKHGTCAASLYDGPTGPIDYFTAALNLHERWDFEKILRAHGIKQSTAERPLYYDLWREILPAIESSVGAKVIVACAAARDGGPPELLAEIRVCVARDTDHKISPDVMNCPDDVIAKETTCNAAPHGVRLPAFPELRGHLDCPWP
eukprot:m51a1_g7751 hypothetical protein (291) ;mRNA; f:50191-51437